ncbi:MAG: hypothetical protein WD342_05860 [Verrucomicrobiales bacterium]
MKNTLLAFSLAALLAAPCLEAQIGQQMTLLNSPDYENAAQPLRNAPPRQYNFSKAVLSDVMRLMAEDAGIGFFGLPDGVDDTDKLVTFTINASPFTALETLAKANGVSLIYENGIWYLRPANDQALIGRIYEINYNAQELVTKNTQAGLTSGGGAGGGAGGGSAGAGLDLQGAPDFFVTEPSRILEDIQNILDIPTTGGTATFAPTASVDTMSQLSLGSLQGQPNLATASSPRGSGGNGADGEGQAKVIWNSDSNTIYVVATRQQHQWIEAYLASADRPQPMIAVEVKFLETSRDPSTDFGINWDGALGDNGLEIGLSDASGPLNLAAPGGYALPTAVLSYSDLNWKLRALYRDSRTRSVSYPRMVTLDNREVSFRSVINQPVLGSSSSASLGAGATQTSSVEYLPIGTVINILPKRMAGDKILLNVSVTVSDIVGTEVINGNPFPIATSRVYTAPLTVKSGYTVAISGLDAARNSEVEQGLPILGRLPVIGHAFKNHRRDRSRQHLMMLITPIAMESGTEGVTKKPMTREPWADAPMATAYPKAPIGDPYPSPVENLRAHPIEDVPAFEDPVAERKAKHTFGKKAEMEAAPAVADVSERSLGADSNLGGARALATTEAAPKPETAQTVDAKPIPSSLNTPMIVEETFPAAPEPEEAPDAELASETVVETSADKPEPETVEDKPQPDAVVASAPVEPEPKKANSDKPSPEVSDETSSELEGRIAEIMSGVDDLKKRLSQVPEGESRLSPDDAQMVVNIHQDARELLDRVDEVRGDKSRPLQGKLGDAWWDLINVKTQATKVSRRSPESLALNGDGEDDDGRE